MLEQFVLIIHVVAALGIIGLILLQQGKGADMGASFGSGGSQTLLGVQGGGNLLTRWTAIFAATFFATSLALAYFAKQQSLQVDGLVEPTPAVVEVSEPVNDEIPVMEESSAGEEIPVEAVSGTEGIPSAEDIPSSKESSEIPE